MTKEYNQENSELSINTIASVTENQKIQIEPGLKEVMNNNDSTLNQPTSENESSDKKKMFFRVMTFIALQVSLFLGALDSTIVSTILPHVGSEFNETSIVSWVATAYILTFDAFQPLYAKLSDIFGRKRTLIFAISLFLFGSLLCGVSTTMIMLIISRAIAGIGAAGIFNCVYVIISEIVPLEKRGKYQGVINAVFACASVFGPLIGGGFTDNITWRWCFYINLPIGGVAITLLIFFLDLPIKKSPLMEKLKRIDYVGAFVFLIAAILFLLALNFGSGIFPWRSTAVLVPLIFSFVIFGVFAFVESKVAKEPIMPPRLIKNRSVFGVILVNLWFGLSFFSLIYYLPVYFQVVKGDNAMWSGIRLIPMQMSVCVFSILTGLLITKFQVYRPFLWIGTCVITLHVGLVSLFDADTDFSKIYGITVIGGAGMGLLFSSTIIAIQSPVDRKDISVATGLNNFSRLLGSALGISISSSILNSELNRNLSAILPPEYANQVMKQALYVQNGLPEEYKTITIQAYCDSIHYVWYIITPITALSIIGALLVKHHQLRKPGQPNNNNNNNNINQHDQQDINNNEKIQVENQQPEKKSEIVIEIKESSNSK